MSAYIVSTMAIHDAETYSRYTELSPGLIAKYGGRFLTRGAPVRLVEGGEHFDGRMVIIEFPDEEAAEAWYDDPEYQRAAEFRHAASTGTMLLQDGVGDATVPDTNL